MTNGNNVQLRKVAEDLYELGDRLFAGNDPIAIHPVVDKAAREFTDGLMRELDVSFAEFADTAHIDRARFRDWWAGEPGAQLTARDVYEIDQLNGELIQGRIRQAREQQEREQELYRDAQSRQNENNARHQSNLRNQQVWDNIIANAPAPEKKPNWYAEEAQRYLEANPPETNEEERRFRENLARAIANEK